MVKKKLLCGLIACVMVTLALPIYAFTIEYAQPIGSITASEDIDALFDSAFLIEENTNTIIYGKEIDKSFSPVGSAVSLMVAYIVANEADLEREIPVIDEVNELPDDVRKIDLEPGQRWLVKDLVAAMLLQGAQDAALVLSNHISVSVGAFASRMNEYAAKLGMSGTHYTNPLGGYDSEQTTTVFDLAILTKTILENDYLSELLSIPYYNTASGHGIENRMEVMQPERSNYDARVKGLGAGATSTAGTNTLLRLVDGERDFLFIGYSATVSQKDCEKNAVTVIDSFATNIGLADITARVNELLAGASIQTADGSEIAVTAAADKINALVIGGTALDQTQLALGELPQPEAAVEPGTAVGEVAVRLSEANIALVPLVSGEVLEGHAAAPEKEIVKEKIDIPIYSAEDWEAATGEKTFIEEYGCWIVIGATLVLAVIVVVAAKYFSRKKH